MGFDISEASEAPEKKELPQPVMIKNERKISPYAIITDQENNQILINKVNTDSKPLPTPGITYSIYSKFIRCEKNEVFKYWINLFLINKVILSKNGLYTIFLKDNSKLYGNIFGYIKGEDELGRIEYSIKDKNIKQIIFISDTKPSEDKHQSVSSKTVYLNGYISLNSEQIFFKSLAFSGSKKHRFYNNKKHQWEDRISDTSGDIIKFIREPGSVQTFVKLQDLSELTFTGNKKGVTPEIKINLRKSNKTYHGYISFRQYKENKRRDSIFKDRYYYTYDNFVGKTSFGAIQIPLNNIEKIAGLKIVINEQKNKSLTLH